MLNKLQKLNQEYNIVSIFEKSFKTYGRVIKKDIKDIIDIVSSNAQSQQNNYIKSDAILEQHHTIKELSKMVYGHMDTITGIVSGTNRILNGIEYHQGSETIMAMTDFVLVVGHLWDMEDNKYNSKLCECFYVPKGTIVECYSTTLHYTPICTQKDGFIIICMLLKGTGDIIEKRQGILKKKNKWFIAHADNKQKIIEGDFLGLEGKMIKINMINPLP